MASSTKQWLIDKRDEFEKEYSDIMIRFREGKYLNGFYILMVDRKNQDKYIERMWSTKQINCANFDILWHEFMYMRSRLMK